MCNLASIAEEVRSKGSVLVGTLTMDLFVQSAKDLTESLKEVPSNILALNYKKFKRNHKRNMTVSKSSEIF